jgi:hypothetical protein
MKPSDWRPIETAPEREWVLVWDDGDVREAQLRGYNSWFAMHGESPNSPTHWQPIVGPNT